MVHVQQSKVIPASADTVWSIVSDFGGLPRWFPFVQRSELSYGGAADKVGTIRTNHIDGGGPIQEQLIERSDRDRRIAYAVVGGDVATWDYSSTLTVHDVTDDGSSYVEWSADFDVDPAADRDATIEWVRTGIFTTCLNELARIVTTGQAD